MPPPARFPAEYYYGVWLKHLLMAHERGMKAVPATVAELGPGSTVGVGLAALLSGARRYIGLDVVKHTDLAANVGLLDELGRLFARRAPAPAGGWPELGASSSRFPDHVLDDRTLAAAGAPERVAAIRRVLCGQAAGRDDVALEYVAPWSRPEIIEKQSVDFLLSHCVLEYVADVAEVCRSARAWLRPGGVMSHQIDLGAHRLSRRWYGNWVYPRWMWRIVAGGRAYSLNRQPASAYIDALRAAGLELTCELKHTAGPAPRPTSRSS